METNPIIYAFYDQNPQFYNFHFKVTNPEKTNLDGYKVELLLKWKYGLDDIVWQNWFTSSGNLIFTAEPTDVEDIFKFTITFGHGTTASQYESETNCYTHEATFGIRTQNYIALDKEGSPSLLDENGKMIQKYQYDIFPNISLIAPTAE